MTAASAEDEDIEAALARLRDDRDRGAAEIAEDALELLAEAAARTAAEGRDPAAAARALARRIAALRPSMAPLANWAAAYAAALGPALDGADGPAAAAHACRTLGERLRARKRGFTEAIVAAARPVLGGLREIVTLSRSSTVEAVLARASAPEARITVCESRPRFEGRRLCAALEAAARRVRCVTDAQMAVALAEADAAVIGADAILRDRSAVNKVGSLALALIAAHLGKPLYVIADSFKIDPAHDRRDAVFEAMDGGEVWPERPEICLNVYFEAVPADLVTSYITEDGAQNGAQIAAAVKRTANLRISAGLGT